MNEQHPLHELLHKSASQEGDRVWHQEPPQEIEEESHSMEIDKSKLKEEMELCEQSTSQSDQQNSEQLNQNRLQQYQQRGEQHLELPSKNEVHMQEENTASVQVQYETAGEKSQMCHQKLDEVLVQGDKQRQEDLKMIPMESSGVENQLASTEHPGILHSGGTHSERQGVMQGQHEVPPTQHKEQEKQIVTQDHSSTLEREAKALVDDMQEKHKPVQEKGKEQPNQQSQQNVIKKNSSDKQNQVKQKQEQQTKKQKPAFVGENYERINYLVQTSRALVSMGESDSDSSSLDFDRPLASQTGSLATAVGRRCLIRLTPSLKRMLCKGCGTSLIFGVNARVRHRSNRQKHTVITCLTCKTIKRYVSDPKHKLWWEQEEALV